MMDYSYKIQSNDMDKSSMKWKKQRNKKLFTSTNFILLILSIIALFLTTFLLVSHISEKNTIPKILSMNKDKKIILSSKIQTKKITPNFQALEADKMNTILRELSLNMTYYTDKYYSSTSQEEKYKLSRLIHKLYYEFEKKLNKEKRLIDEKNKIKNRNIYQIKRFNDGDVYYGEVNKNDQMEGYGYYFGDKFTYSGNFSNNKMNGKCAIYYSDGYYKGDIVNEELTGKGIIQLNNGEKYEGGFKKNHFNEYGVYSGKNGTYEGYWKDGVKNGKGKYTSKNGDIYEGDFKNGKIEGKGKLTYSSGGYYEGEFLDNLFHGKGKYQPAKGDALIGVWTRGVINKKVTNINKN